MVRSIVLISLFASALSCGGSSQSKKIAGTVETVTIESQSLASSLTGESTAQRATVYLPPSYADGTRNYPVVYYFHGFGGSYADLEGNIPDIDPVMAGGSVSEFIIVGVNGMSALGGSFWVNSAATGSWEDYAVSGVVSYIDAHYRTLPSAASRGICGFSMGGFAAINLALRHPDVYGAVWVLAPGLFDANGLRDAMPIWQNGEQDFLTAYGAAFAPGTDSAAHYAQIPLFSGTAGDDAIAAAWENGFGNLQSKVDAYLAKAQRLSAICLEYNAADYYAWIPRGTRRLSDILTAASIDHTLTERAGNHGDGIAAIYPGSMLPFFSAHLSF